MEDIFEVGKWLEFEANTCFGQNKKHFGILVGVDPKKRKVVVAANATSKIEKLILFADLHNIPIEDATVDVTDDIHFSMPTGIDCHRAQEVSLDEMISWARTGKIHKTNYNEDVDPAKYKKIVGIVLRSPMVEESAKEIIRKSNKMIIEQNLGRLL